MTHDRAGWREAFWLSDIDHHPNVATHELHARALIEKLGEMDVIGKR